jgi:glycosyltransferase involved in cell wall biosynthesis
VKVLIVHDYGTLSGGAEHMSHTLREGLRRRGHRAEWFSSSARPLPLPIVSDHTCFGDTGVLGRAAQAVNAHAAMRLRAVMKRFQPDIVHVRMFLTQLSPLILPLLRRVPAILHCVNYDTICPLNTKTLPDGTPCQFAPGWPCHRCGGMLTAARAQLQHTLWRRWMGIFDSVVANSEWTARRLREHGVPVAEVIHNGVPERPARSPLGDPPTAAFAGRLAAKKGVEPLLHAWVLVRREAPTARLLIAGDGPERAALQGLTARLGLSAGVSFLGYLPRAEMEAALASAWVQVAPSLWEEPFGLVAAEASMRGTAAVVSRRGGLAEVIEEGVTGFAVDPTDVATLAERLLRVLRDRDLAERLGAAGRRRALEYFTDIGAIDRFETLYSRIIGASLAAERHVAPQV